jgi:hypothetical protein
MQPFTYERIDESTWMYVSSFLILSFFFKFNRMWSIRNLDLFLIIFLAPGLLLIQSGRKEHNWYRIQQQQIQRHELEMRSQRESQDSQDKKTQDRPIINQASFRQTVVPQSEIQSSDRIRNGSAVTSDPAAIDDEATDERNLNEPGLARQRYGYYWMFSVGGLIMIRMLVDPLFVRRPNLEPNLSIGGMVFMGVSLLMLVLANVATYSPGEDDIKGARNAVKMLRLEAASETEDADLVQRGPGYRLLYLLPVLSTFENSDQIRETGTDSASNKSRFVIASKSVAITSQVLIVLGLILFSHYHFGNFHAGVGIATIYMLLPYTAIFTGNVMHTVPAAMMVWALVCFRRPFLAGIFLGLATGVSYYPLFLLPLWLSFYWERGSRRMLAGFLTAIFLCVVGLFFTSSNLNEFVRQVQAMFAFWFPIMNNLDGIWALGPNQIWRQPLLIAFVALCVSFAAWPAEKNIGTLVAYTAAVMAAVQFWHGFGGGLYVAWYLPLVLLAVFRPNVSGRIATEEVNEFKSFEKKQSAVLEASPAT